ncbi:MAG: DUF6580 family putative transport protein [Janthinobacterium lividum]
MLAYLVLLFAVLSRFLPHALHGIGLNFTAVGGGLLFFGARRSPWQASVAAGVMAITDVCLTRFVYDYPFHVQAYLLTWGWYAGVCLLGSGLLRQISAPRVIVAVFCSSTSFFLLSNFDVWLQGGLYSRNAAGLGACFAAALPFYANDLVSTGLTATVLFAFPVVAGKLVTTWQQSLGQEHPFV